MFIHAHMVEVDRLQNREGVSHDRSCQPILHPSRDRASGPCRAASRFSSGCRGGVGGNSVAQILQDHCPDLALYAGMVIEQLDSQVGTWQFSTDGGRTWRTVRTDLINRAGSLGLALDRDARLRVLPFGGSRVSSARVAFHAVRRSPGQGNGSYRAYATEDREEDSSTVTLVLGLGAINGLPPAVHVPRPRNKRASVQRAAQAVSAGSTGHALAIA